MELFRNLYAVVIASFILIKTGVSGQGSIAFVNDMDGYAISESLSAGTEVYTLSASAMNGANTNFQFTITSPNNEFNIPDPATGKVFLAKKLNFETSQTISAEVSVSNGELSVSKSVTINVVDANDETPYFTEQTYEISIPENIPRNSIILRNLTVMDADSTNEVINVECAASTAPQFSGSCDIFELSVRAKTKQLWRGDITVRNSLDAEAKRVYQIPVRASDEALVAFMPITVRVTDIQDTPPVWQPSQVPTVSILENSAIGLSILNISAMDGDVENKRAVALRLIVNPGNLFTLQLMAPGEGNIKILKEIRREDSVFTATGSVQLKLQACEILQNGLPSTAIDDCSLATVTVVVEDVNNFPPTFAKPVYEVNIYENIAVDTPLPNLKLKVTDQDQGNNAVFDVILEDYADMFTVMPSRGTRDLTASIYVTNVSTIEYESPTKLYELNLIARETISPEKFSSQALVRVHVLDFNDNPPKFPLKSYSASVSELATGGTPVIKITATDKDSGKNGESSLWYKMLGNGAEKFRVNLQTGQVTVRNCLTPGKGNCLDAEETGTYTLNFICTDRYGEGLTASVLLTITVTDENDNPPIFTIPNIVSFITEGKTEPNPKVQVKATDADVSDPIRYTIVGGNIDSLWQIGSVTGVVAAVRPVDYEAIPGNTGRYILTIEATDGRNTVTGEVIINVIDTNDHAPVFDVSNYFQEISELTPPGTFIDRVEANDQDSNSLPSGQIQYRITQGGQDKFSLNTSTGDITVAAGAIFDYDVQNRYEMRVVAEDQGSPQKSATATVVVGIRDVNNKDPFFQPSTVRESVREDASIGTPVVTMMATDPDKSSSLIYFLEEPITAYSPTNEPVNPQQIDFKTMFNIERNTGIVRVDRTLSYDSVARYQTMVKARDNAGITDQTATATLIITILQVNKRPPVFGEPWSPSNPSISITVNEGQPPSTYVTTLVATDSNDAIREYKITSDPGNHFNINPTTGTVTIKTPLDYETQQNTKFTVIAVDNGEPPMTATATIFVNIDNINDETPTFTKSNYNIDLPENSPSGTLVVRMNATDKDQGDFGQVRYSLDDPLNRFTINPISGDLTVLDGAVLDREETDTITLTVTAYDSPNNNDTRRYAQMPVYIKLVDVNDNHPIFPQQEYIAVIPGNAPNQTNVVQVVANDRDAPGPNSKLTYYEVNGDPQNLFIINPVTGLIVTNRSLIGFSGTYNLTVGARDNGNSPLSGTTQVKIQVLQANNYPPFWTNPKKPNETRNFTEKNYIGKEIIYVQADDIDTGKNGEIEYGFLYKKQFVDQTPEFEINPNTGQITAKRKFDREEKDFYTLHLAARDKGDFVHTIDTFLFIKIEDLNDNNPEFPQFANCCTIPVNLSVSEDISVNTEIGNVTAHDADTGVNAKVYYKIIDGNVNDVFQIGTFTGQLTTNKPLDHEKQNFYNLTIQASNENAADVNQVIGSQCRCSNPSLLFVYIHVLDKNDFPPVFAQKTYRTCVPVEAELGKRVAVLEAIDNDSKTSKGVSYSIRSSVNYNSLNNDKTQAPDDAFIIGKNNGSVFTNALMVKYENHYFVLGVRADDIDNKFSQTQLYVWVTTSNREITMTFDQPPDQVRDDLDSIIKRISELTGNGIVCVSDLSYHVTSSNLIDNKKTDLTFHVINNSTLVVMVPGVVIGMLDGKMAAFGAVGIMASYSYWDGFIIDPVLAAVIVIFILLLIALLLLCCLCWCLAALFGKKETYAYDEKPLYLGTINPLWGHKFYEDQELNMAVKEHETIEPSPGIVNKAYEDEVDAVHKVEEKHVRETRSAHNYDSSHMVTAANGHVGSGVAIRIEAPLEGEATMGKSDFIPIGKATHSVSSRAIQRNVNSIAVMTDDDRSDIASSKAHSRVGFGATLTRPDHQQERVISDTYSDLGEYHQSVSGVGSTRYHLYTGSQIPPSLYSNHFSTLLGSEEIGHDISAHPDVFASNGYIDQIDEGTYRGEINVPGSRTPEVTSTYVISRDNRTVLN